MLGPARIVVVGFNWLHYGFGWTLGGTAETMASHRVDVALVAAYTPGVLEPRRLCQESRACNNPRCHRTQQQCRPLVRRCSHEIARGTRAEEVSRYSGSISPYRTGRGFAGFLRAQTLLICRWGFLFPHKHVRSGVLVSTNRLFALVTASQIASASASSFFCRFTYGLLAWFRDGARRSFSLQASPAGSFLFLCVPCAGRRRARFNPATGTAAGRDYGWTLLGNRIIFRS